MTCGALHAAGNVTRASLEALGAARSASDDVTAILCGDGAKDAAANTAGATHAVCLGGSSDSPDAVAKAIAEVVKERGAKAFIASSTSTGRDLVPRVAALLAHWPAVVFITMTLGSSCFLVASEPRQALAGFGTLALGAIVYLLSARRSPRGARRVRDRSPRR